MHVVRKVWLTCEQCGKDFQVEAWRLKERTPKFCSRECGWRWLRGKTFDKTPSEIRCCAHCGREFTVFQTKLRRGWGKYCCKACKDADHEGRARLGRGYIGVLAREHPAANSDGYVMEHRLVMESVLGRRLARHEVVHHINGDIRDNRPENLKLFSSHSEHVRAHNLMRWRRKRGEELREIQNCQGNG